MKKIKIITALIFALSFTVPASVLASSSETDLETVYEKDEIKNEDKLLDLADKQENIDYIDVAGEEIPLMIDSSNADVSTDALPDAEEELETKTVTEVLELQTDEEGNYEADLVSTIFVEADEDGVISSNLIDPIEDNSSEDNESAFKTEKQSTNFNGLFKFLAPMAAWTDTQTVGKKGAKESIYISAKVYYHQQKKNGNTHVDMNSVSYSTSIKKTGAKITRRSAEVAQTGATKYGRKPLLKQTKQLSFTSNSYKYNVPDSWVPISSTNGWVGTQFNLTSTYKGSQYYTTVNCLVLNSAKLGW
ncbi:hypothetical protein HBP49_06620 [Listeria welshimeri]|nr:hypothetical protein [Listeria welshimeri]